MKTSLKFLILFLLIPFSLASANINTLFAKFYYSNNISPRHCGQNVNNFVRYLAKNGSYTPEFKVLYFEAPSNPWGMYKVVGLNSRWGKKLNGSSHESWDFHVVGVYKGKVYDFSFNDSPKVLPLVKYFEEMLIPKRPVAINGNTFRVRGKGPHYTAEFAREELEDHRFKVLSIDQDGRQSVDAANLDFRQMLRLLN